ncbi:hypothetical protein QMK19_27375 [Streptomyces sp. H10-C2]|nr:MULTISPECIES: hypothetical protein [unclassified Streptomyces]MDJ0343755.1 hypothetical protein [Streptomyces sp. PH10-H1]MDJ0373276.1 hypothetical protein [Streptomyces sp. H10-C2]
MTARLRRVGLAAEGGVRPVTVQSLSFVAAAPEPQSEVLGLLGKM